jgi:DNA replication and repair protein RecF
MIAKKLNMADFRNIKEEEINFSEGVNILCGENAQGKTNILEALWFFSSGKSFRATKEKDVIRFQQPLSKLSLLYETKQRESNLEMNIPRTGKKEIFINGVKAKKQSELVGSFTSVLFSPEHLTLIKDGPSERRRFIDFAMCQLKPRYLMLLSEYLKLLERRNAALKTAFDKTIYDTLDIWDEKLSVCGSELIVYRNEFVKSISTFAYKNHYELSGGLEELSVKYIWFGGFEPTSKEETSTFFLEELKKHRENDIKEGNTAIGPHRDDIEILINGFPARIFASQGQQRSAVLSLKIAEGEMISKEYGEEPVLLLDDVLSELDTKRQEFIIKKIENKQVIITCCEPERFVNLTKGKVFNVSAGNIKHNS